MPKNCVVINGFSNGRVQEIATKCKYFELCVRELDEKQQQSSSHVYGYSIFFEIFKW